MYICLWWLDLAKAKISLTGAVFSNAPGISQVGPQGPIGAQGPQGEKGATGDKGDTGAQGAAGATTVVTRINQKVSQASNDKIEVFCEDGEVAVSGGGGLNGGTITSTRYVAPGGVALRSDGFMAFDDDVPVGWQISWANQTNSLNTYRVFVICASP